MIGLIILITLSFGIAYWLFMKYENKVVPYIVAMPVSVVVTVAIDRLIVGYLDPFAILVVPLMSFISLGVIFVAYQIYSRS